MPLLSRLGTTGQMHPDIAKHSAVAPQFTTVGPICAAFGKVGSVISLSKSLLRLNLL
jgi:hypothetical protein